MISWLQGKKIDLWEQSKRIGLVINCSGVGYEVQLLERNLKETSSLSDITLWVHQVTRDDGSFLFGFIDQADRDLFRILITVSGIGPQIAISLMEGNDSSTLISAILNKDIATLTDSPGVGKKTGERLIIELQNKLSHISQSNKFKSEFIETGLTNEVKVALRNLDYKDSEITMVLNTLLTIDNPKAKNSDSSQNLTDFETLFKKALILLSQKVG